MENSTRNSPLLSETDGYENMAQQRIMRCTRETNQIMGKTVVFLIQNRKISFRKTKRKEKENTIKFTNSIWFCPIKTYDVRSTSFRAYIRCPDANFCRDDKVKFTLLYSLLYFLIIFL